MTLPTENVTQNVRVHMEMDAKTVDKQPTAVPDITPTGKQPAEKADRLRGGCIPCPVRPLRLDDGLIFNLYVTSSVDAFSASPYLAACN